MCALDFRKNIRFSREKNHILRKHLIFETTLVFGKRSRLFILGHFMILGFGENFWILGNFLDFGEQIGFSGNLFCLGDCFFFFETFLCDQRR